MKYNAFISYSHSQDANLAPAIERALEKFAKPTFKRRALRIFRDSNDLSISPDLWGKIEDGLRESEYLVYCASAASAKSYYCNQEVKYWMANKSMDNFLLVITDGEIAWDFQKNDFDWEKTTAVPELLSGAFKNEPLYVDFRDDLPKERMNLDDADFKSKLIYIAATLHKKPVGDMVGEGIKQHKRTLRIRNTALTTVFSLMAIAMVLMVSSIKRRIASQLHFQAKSIVQDDPSIALRVEAAALKRYNFSEFRNTALSIIANNTFYKILEKNDSTYAADFALSPVDSIIAVGYNDGNVGLMNLKGEALNSFGAHDEEITSISMSSDSKLLITTSYDRTAKLWDLDGNLLTEFVGHTNRVNAASFTPEGNVLTASTDGSIRLFDQAGNTINIYEDPEFGFDDVAVVDNGQYLIALTSGLSRGGIMVWSMDGIEKTFIPFPWATVMSPAPDGQSFLAGNMEGATSLIGIDGETIARFQGPDAPVSALTFSPDGQTLIVAFANGDGQHRDLKGTLLDEFKGHHQPINGVQFSTNAENVITSSYDQTIRIWQLERIEKASIRQFEGLDGWISDVGFSPNGKQVLAADESGNTLLWDLNGDQIKRMEGQQFGVGLVNFIDKETILTTSKAGGNIKKWKVNSDVPEEFNQDLMHYHPVAVSSDGSKVFFGGTMVFGGLLWDLDANTTTEFEGLRFDSAKFSPDGRLILVGGKDGIARLFDLEGSLIKEYDAHGFVFTTHSAYSVTSLAFSNDGQTIAMGSDDGAVRIADVKGRVLADFMGHDATVNSLKFSPDGKSLLSVSYDRSARLWDLRGTLLSDFSSQTGEVSAMAFSPDGKTMLAGGKDGSLKLIRFVEVEEFLDKYVQPLNLEQRKLYEID